MVRIIPGSQEEAMLRHKRILLMVALLSLAAAGCKDKEKPAWPQGAELEADDVTGTSMTLGWPAAADNEKVKAYRILGERDARANKKKLAGLPRVIGKVGAGKTSFSASGLSEAAGYAFKVTAVDQAGNVSPPLLLTVTTKDLTKPAWKDGAKLTITRVVVDGKTRLTFTWPAAGDNVAVTGYRLKQDKKVFPVEGKGETLIHTLIPDRPHGTWWLQAGDAAGNWSNPPLSAQLITKPALPMDEAALAARAAARRARLAAHISKMGVLKLLGTKGRYSGRGGAWANLRGSGRVDLDRAFSGTGGLAVARRGGGGGGLRGRGGGGSGKAVGIGDLGGRGVGGTAVGGVGPVSRRPRPTAKLGSGPVEVARYMRRKMPRVRRCYQTALKKSPGLSGDVKVTLTADAAGKVRVSSVSATDARFTACLKTALLGSGKAGLSGTVTIKLNPGKSSK